MSTMVATQPEAMPKAELTPEELLAMPDGGHYELIDGEPRERKVSVLSSIVAVNVSTALNAHCAQTGAGVVLDSELGYRCFPWKPGRIRRADVSFIRSDRLSKERLSEGFCSIAPDLAVEVVSPNDLVSELDQKVEEYLRAGVRLVWEVHPEIRAIQVYRADGTAGRFREHDEISGEDVVPGFRCQVGSLFPRVTQANADDPTKTDAVSETPHS
jgi:Uma2 family endonuclease